MVKKQLDKKQVKKGKDKKQLKKANEKIVKSLKF